MLVATAMLSVAASADAGEVTGTGTATPVNGYVASSICSFSGLNDDGTGPSAMIQSYGMFIRAFGMAGSPVPSPGVACRGN